MDDAITVILLSVAMLVGCYLAGCVPLAFTFSEEKLKMVTVFGAGLLVGTALVVIIPEGVNSVYSSGHSHEGSSVSHVAKRSVVGPADVPGGQVQGNPPVVPAVDPHGVGSSPHHSHEGGGDAHKWIGVALVLGFVFMLIVDQIAGGHEHSTGGVGQASDVESPPAGRLMVTATLGLVVHAAADGIALGAATSVSQTGLSLIVFTAIMLHKAPASFGLVSFLLHEGHDRGRIRRHLALFSAAAPVMAIVTFVALNGQNKDLLEEMHATGLTLLFSAGTFLYVSTVHILPEVSSHTSRSVLADGTTIVRSTKGLRFIELIAMVIGSLLPIVLELGHHH